MRSSLKRTVWARDNYICFYCGTKLDETTATVDHKHPQSLLAEGEGQKLDNLVTACMPCNKTKADRVFQPGTCVKIPNYLVLRYEPRENKTQ